jgi:hypothetical protein
MTTPTPLDEDPAQLRQRAEETRREADRTVDPIGRDTLLGIATQYEKLAALAETKQAKATAAETKGSEERIVMSSKAAHGPSRGRA